MMCAPEVVGLRAAMARGVFAVISLLPCAVRAQSARDWTTAPAIVEVQTLGDIFALGDVHGDYERMMQLLRRADLVDRVPDTPSDARWAGGDAVLVCTGDLIDKGDRALDVIAALSALRSDAERNGGRVIVTMGNHEAEFLADPNDDKHEEFLGELADAHLAPAAVVNGTDGQGVGVFLCTLPFAAKVNDWFFAHAGNTHGLSLIEMRAALEAGVNRSGFDASILSDDDSLLKARLHPKPWWERSGDEEGDGEKRLRRHVRALGAAHLVIGHQPGNVDFDGGPDREKGKPFAAFDGLIFLNDVGLSRAVGNSKGSILRIHGRSPVRVTVIDHEGDTSRLWTEH